MNRNTVSAVAVLCLLALFLASAAGCGSGKKPNIETLNPTSGPAGTQLVISGKNFGDAQGSGVVHVGGKVANVVAWTGVDVIATVPSGIDAAQQGVTVLTAQGESNQVDFTVTKGSAPPAPDRKPGQVEGNTPAQAMQDFMKKKGVDTSGWTFSVVKQSTVDPNWKIDRADKTGQQTLYFLLKKVNSNWVVVDDGNAMTPQELQGDGAPSDLWLQLPTPPPQNQQLVVQNYLTSKGIDINGVEVNLVKASTTDPSWELFQVVFPPERQMVSQYVVLHLESNAWVVKSYGSVTVIDGTPGMPSDLKL